MFLLVVMLVFTALLYLPGLPGPFLFDDPPNLIFPLQAWLDGKTGWQEIVFGNRSGLLGRPISMLTFLANAVFSGLEVVPYKATNLATHLIIGGLIYTLFSRLLRHDPWLGPHSKKAALAVAAIWLIHPLQVSTVLYVVQRMAQLSTLFTLVALLVFVIARDHLEARRIRTGLVLLFIGVPVATLAAAFSKENGLLVIPLCAIIEFCYFRPRAAKTSNRTTNIFFAIFLVIPGLLASFWYALPPSRLLGGYVGRTFTLTERLLSEPRALFDYIGLLLFPRGAAMGLYTDDFPVSTNLFTPATTIFAIIGVITLVLFALWLRRRAPAVALGILFFFVAHAMESTIFPLEIYFEHRNYLASIGIFLALIGSGAWLLSVIQRHEIGTPYLSLSRFALLGFCAVLSVSTFARTSAWRYWPVLAEQGMRYHPQSLRAHLDYASMQMAQGMFNEAEQTFENLTQLENTYASQVGAINVVFVQCYRDNQASSESIARMSSIAGTKLELGQMLAFESLGNRVQKNPCQGLPPHLLADIIVHNVDSAPQTDSLRQLWRSRFAAAQLYDQAGDKNAAITQAALAWMTNRADTAVGIYLTKLYIEAGAPGSARIILDDTRRKTKSWDKRNQSLADQLEQHLQ